MTYVITLDTWQIRAEQAETELQDCHDYLNEQHVTTDGDTLLERITALVAERDAAQVAAHMARLGR